MCTASITLGAVVLFTQTEYFVHESDLLLDVCVSLDGATEVPISVMLALQQDDQLPSDIMATRKRTKSMRKPALHTFCLLQLDLTLMH